jgi:hypothetical protein
MVATVCGQVARCHNLPIQTVIAGRGCQTGWMPISAAIPPENSAELRGLL